MNGHVPRIWRPQLSVSGLCRLVGLVDVFLACLLPLKQANRDTIELFLFFEALLTPIVLAIAFQFLVRRGVLRLWITWFLLALPLALLLGGIVLLLFGMVRGLILHGDREYSRLDAVGLAILFVLIGSACALGIILVHLVARLLPAPCTQCGRRRLFSDMRAKDDRRLGPWTFGRCVVCGARFERWLQGPWQPVEPGGSVGRAAREERPSRIDESWTPC